MIIHFLGPLVLNGSLNLVVAIFVEDSLSKNVYALESTKECRKLISFSFSKPLKCYILIMYLRIFETFLLNAYVSRTDKMKLDFVSLWFRM